MDKLMYLGPNRPFDLPLASRAVFAWPPEQVIPGLAQKFGAYPALRKLFVPIADVPAAKAQLALQGSALATIYNKIKSASDAWRKESANG